MAYTPFNTTTRTPNETDSGVIVRSAPQNTWRTTFSRSLASTVDSNYFTVINTGTGQAISQSSGNLVMTSGTTVNAETILRSVASWNDTFELRHNMILSQRIVNNNFYVEVVDVLGDGLAITINSSTSVTVTIPGTTLVTPDNVGQSMYLGGYTGTGTFVPGRYAIASISGTAITFTVAGFAAGSGTCSVFGWNYHQILYTGTTVTNSSFDTQRNGWNSGGTTATINTTASPGSLGQIFNDGINVIYSDSVTTSTITPNFAVRAIRFQNIPVNGTNMFLQIRMANGTTAPASTTTATIGFVSVEDSAPAPVRLQSGTSAGAASLNVSVQNTPSINALGTVTTVSTVTNVATIGTSVTPGTAATNLGKAKASAAGATDTGVAVLLQRTDAPAAQSATGNYVLSQADSVGALLVHQVQHTLKTYSASANLAPAATATDIATITGNATTTVYVTKVFVSGTQTTFGLVDTQLIKRSTVDSGGTSAGITATPHDSNSAAASATLLSYTANPTALGTAVGTPIRRGYVPYAALTSTIAPTVVFDFGQSGQPVVLRGTTQQLAINLNSTTITGGAITVNFEWFEL